MISGADRAKGTTVVIDVFRAFSPECYHFSRGVEKIHAGAAGATELLTRSLVNASAVAAYLKETSPKISLRSPVIPSEMGIL